nr:hypothetical protein RF1 [Erycibe henryi]BDR61712.1 hypothetical protein RF1 [Erycibe henryi]
MMVFIFIFLIREVSMTFQLLCNLCLKIINSVVVVGLYYGFLTAFSIKPSYLFFLVMEEESTKRVAATTGFITGQLMIFISIYYAPLYLALGRPHTITVLALHYFFFHLFWNTSTHKRFFDYGSTNRNSMRNLGIQCVFLNNLILQLLNTCILPSSTLARLVSIYLFRCNNKMLFVTSSFVAWLIGQILVRKCLELGLVWIRKNHSIRSIIRSNKYLFLLRNSIFGSLLFFISIHSLGRIPSPILTQKLSEVSKTEEKLKSEEEGDEEIEQEQEGSTEEDPSPSPFSEERGDSDKEFDFHLKETDYKVYDSEFEILEKNENKELEKPLVVLLFDYKRWYRPLRYIKNNRLEQAVRNEMSQSFFDTYQSDGKERISFTHPISLATFWKMIKRRIPLLSLEKTLSNELDNGWVSRNKQKENHLKNDFLNRINNLDKGVGILETRTRLCIDNDDDETKQDYLPKMYDPFLNGPYRGRIKKELSPSIINNTSIENSSETVMLNRLHGILVPNPNYQNFDQNTDTFEKKPLEIGEFSTLSSSFNLMDSEQRTKFVKILFNAIEPDDQNFLKKSIGIKEISKKVPRWSYRLISEVEQLSNHKNPPDDHEIRSRKGVSAVIFDETDTTTTDKETNTSKETNTREKETKETNTREKETKETNTTTTDKETNTSKETNTREKETKETNTTTTDKETNTSKETNTREKETKETNTIEKETKETNTIEKETKETNTTTTDKETHTIKKETNTQTTNEDKVNEEDESKLALMRYSYQSNFRRNLIKGSMRTQRRKILVEELFQAYAHSPLFLDRIQNKTFFSFAIPGPVQLKRFFRNWSAGKGFRILESTDEQTKRKEKREYQQREKEEIERLEIGEAWDSFPATQILRGCMLITQSILRKNILLPSLIISKNIGRMLLLQFPEWYEDFQEWNKEMHIKCTYTGIPVSGTEFPENWLTEGIQIKIVFPFRLKPWHRSKPLYDDFCFLTVWGRETEKPFGPPRKTPSFFEPILKELENKIEKYKKITAKSVLQGKIKLFQKVSKETRTINPKIPFIKKTKKELSKGNPIGLFRSREISGMKKEKDSRISNQIINESFSQIKITDWTNSSLIETKMQDMTDRISRIQNQIERITEEKKKVTLELNISPYKKSYRFKLSKNIWQIVKITSNRLICKFQYFIKIFIQRIYNDIFLSTINICRINTQLFLESTKNFIDKYDSKNETNQKRINKKIQNPSNFISNRKTDNSCKKNSDIFCDLSNLSQAYVFYKISQTGVSNLCKLRSVLQHPGTSFFLKTKIKDSFRTQGIVQSEVIQKKLQRSRTSQWKNWLRGNSQYDLSPIIWSSLMSQKQKWRNRVNLYRRSKKNSLNKWNSCGKDRLSHYKKQNGRNSLSNQKDNFEKCYRYDLLSYKSINCENQSHSVTTPQVTKRQAISYNYNMSQNSLFAIRGNIPINKFIGKIERVYIPYIEKDLDRKYFNWEKIHFSLRKKVDIESWIAVNPSSNQNTPIGSNNYQLIDQIDKKEKEKDPFYLPINKNPEINRPNSPNSFFDWMGMNEEILNRPISNLQLWFFPELVRLFNVYKTKPWIIPSELLLLNLNLSETDSKNKSETDSKNKSETDSKNKSETDSKNKSETDSKNKSETDSKNKSETNSQNKSENDSQKKSETDSQNKNIAENQKDLEEDSTKKDMKKDTKQKQTQKEQLELFMKQHFLFQLRWESSSFLQNIHIYCLLLRLINIRKMTLSCVQRRQLNLSIMMKVDKELSIPEWVKGTRLLIEPLRLSVKNKGQFLMYQTIGISLVHKNQTHQQYRKQRIIRARENNHFDALVLEKILSSRRRRELRILICLNSNNWNGVDTNSVFCNENRVKNCSQFWNERNPRDKEKNELIQLKSFLWPNYRLEDLACMNRYWFDTNNGSRFSILRIRMYLPLKIR